VSVRLTGEIDIRANLTRDAISLMLTARATFDVTLTTDPEKFAVVPMTYSWTGTSGSCRWGGSGSDGELRLRLRGLVAERPVMEINGTTPSAECNREHNSPEFAIFSRDNGGGVIAPGVIVPRVYWPTAGGSLEGLGTGTLSYQCVGCTARPSARYDVRAMYGRRIEFKPREPRAGQLVQMSANVVVLEKSSRDTFWTVVKNANVTAKCKIYLRSGRNVRTTLVSARWRTPAETRGDGVVACAPWRLPKNVQPGSKLGFTPVVTYRGKTLTTKLSFWTSVVR
jgi:hypothetical protein